VADAGGVLDRVLIACNLAGAALVGGLLVFINRDALGRTFFAAPVIGVHEIVELSIVAIVFLQLGDVVRVGRLTRSDGFLGALTRRWPAVGLRLEALFDLCGALLMGLILWGAVPKLAESYVRGEFAGTAGLFAVPEWPVRLIIVVGAALTGLKFLDLAVRRLRAAN
jgi:TRAP-type mannitol/chloroaromatic compound transport system permease small subunit